MKRTFLLAVGVLAGIAILVPLRNADAFKDRIQRAIEQALGRRVDISGKARFSLWNGPGFSLTDVVIHEAPAAGIEPFAYVASLGATIRLTSLLSGKWELSRITLDEPTVNLVKFSGGWNVQPLLQRSHASAQGEVPEIRVRGGRINFKLDDTKVVFYCANADVDVSADGDRGLRLRFSVEPARTDRAAQGFGTLTGSGFYRRFGDKPPEVDLELDLERSALADIATLVEGSGTELNGFLAAQARIQGPLNAMRIEGRLRLEDIQRFDLLRAGSGTWPLQYRGTLDFPAGELDIRTRAQAKRELFRLRVRGRSLFSNPAWGAIVEFHELPVGALQELFQYLNVDLPERGGLSGKISGVLGFSQERGLQGMLRMPELSLKLSQGAAQIADAILSVDHGEWKLHPAQLDLGDGVTAVVEGSYSAARQSFLWKSGSRPLPLPVVVSSQRKLLGVDRVPLLERFTGGVWQGALEYTKLADGQPLWSGGFTIRAAKLPLEGLSSPVQIHSATGSLIQNRLALNSIQGAAGEIQFRASLREETTRPPRLQLVIDQLEVAELEKLLLPTLKRSTGILRTLSFRPQLLPDWLRQRRLQLQFQIASLHRGETWLGSLQGKANWDGGFIELAEARWEREEATALAQASVRLFRSEPEYRLRAEVKNLPWMGGELEGTINLETWGTGAALLRNAKSSGKLMGRNLDLGPEADLASMTAAYEFSGARSPSLKLTTVEMVAGAETFTGQGGSETDGKLTVELSSATKRRLRMAGTVWPFQLEVAAR
ncbi:MAG: AsmA family protein [Bryobacteraceae bacterium]|nr:AsmA family protein [Bryobacteraceae bacterium]MDW8377363.1 AsmA family protein [Bryobacterales bacterium]